MKIPHECIITQYGQRISCFEGEYGKILMLTLNDVVTDVKNTNIDKFVCEVNFCPFCGYSLSKTEGV